MTNLFLFASVLSQRVQIDPLVRHTVRELATPSGTVRRTECELQVVEPC